MHLIVTPVRIRAAQYAAALGIRNGDWVAYSTPAAIRGKQGSVHILPGASDDMAAAAKRAHDLRPFNSGTAFVDLRSVA